MFILVLVLVVSFDVALELGLSSKPTLLDLSTKASLTTDLVTSSFLGM